jgi:hypothetical protein
MNSKKKYIFIGVFTFFIVLLFVSCAMENKSINSSIDVPVNPESVDTPTPAPVGSVVAGGVERHFYTSVTSKNDVLKLDHMVTYMLFPREPKNNKVEERYIRLFSLLVNEHDRTGVINKLNPQQAERANRFILMVRDADVKLDLENYNYELSREIMDYFRERFGNTSFKGDGPFLVTTRDGLFDNTIALNMFFLNLDKFDETAISETVKIYKNRLEDDGEIKFSFLDKLKFKILAFVVPANDGVEQIAQIFSSPAYAKKY